MKNYQVLRCPAVLEKTGMTRAGMYREMANGSFPKPIKLSAKAVGWVEEQVDAWIEKRIAASQSEHAA